MDPVEPGACALATRPDCRAAGACSPIASLADSGSHRALGRRSRKPIRRIGLWDSRPVPPHEAGRRIRQAGAPPTGATATRRRRDRRRERKADRTDMPSAASSRWESSVRAPARSSPCSRTQRACRHRAGAPHPSSEDRSVWAPTAGHSGRRRLPTSRPSSRPFAQGNWSQYGIMTVSARRCGSGGFRSPAGRFSSRR